MSFPKKQGNIKKEIISVLLYMLNLLLLIGQSKGQHNDLCSKNKQIQKQVINPDSMISPYVDSTIVHRSENLIIKKLSNHIYQHISFLNTKDFGRVACNGMLVVNENQGVTFDTPVNNESSLELIRFARVKLKTSIIAVVPTHFHEDCIGGIQEFNSLNIPIYASIQTVQLLHQNSNILTDSIINFDTYLSLKIGSKLVKAEYFGAGHTKDNVVGFFPEGQVLFGGCLLKSLGSSKGFLGDANTTEWPETIKKIKSRYPNIRIVIPGHGEVGGAELLDYTIQLF